MLLKIKLKILISEEITLFIILVLSCVDSFVVPMIKNLLGGVTDYVKFKSKFQKSFHYYEIKLV